MLVSIPNSNLKFDQYKVEIRLVDKELHKARVPSTGSLRSFENVKNDLD
jgi:hypothetical protein